MTTAKRKTKAKAKKGSTDGGPHLIEIGKRKNKVFAAINIAGLAVGMTIYVFGGLLVEYEDTHDAFFENSDRTYTVGSYFAPEMNIGIDQINTAWSASW